MPDSQQTLDISLQQPLTERNREALYHFSRTEDREPPLVFVGRDEPVEDIEYALRRSGESGRTLSKIRIVQGPPGAGKTSLLNHLAKKYTGKDAVVPVHLSGNDLVSAPAVASAFMKACGLDPGLLAHAHSRRTEGRVGLNWIGFSVDRHSAVHAPEYRLKTGTPLWDVLNDCLEVPQGTTFLILVDEAQRVRSNSDGKNNAIATQLHDGNTGGVITTTVFAGLSDTASKLSETGISRPPETSIHHLSSLTNSETREAIEGFLDFKDFGVTLSRKDRERLVRVIVRVSEGYPRHLHSYFRALAKQLSERGKRLDFERVLAHGHEMRINYCEMRLNMADLGEYERALFDFVPGNSETYTFNSQDILECALRRGLTRAEAEKAHKNAIHCGVLERAPHIARDQDQVCFPVPSFRTYMGTGGDRQKTLAIMTESHRQFIREIDIGQERFR